MDVSYTMGGWNIHKDRNPYAEYWKLKLLPFSSCQKIISIIYGRVIHNLACAALNEKKLTKVMHTIFHFSIFDIDKVC